MKKHFLLAVASLLIAASVAFAWPTWVGTSVLTQATDNTNSASLTVPRGITYATVSVPTITSGIVYINGSNNGTSWDNIYYLVDNTSKYSQWSTNTGTGGLSLQLPRPALCYKYIRFQTSSEQAANRTFTVYGQ